MYSSQTENNGVLGKINTYTYDGEYLTWTTDGANAGTVFYRTGKFNVTNVCGLLKIINTENLARYIFHVLSVEAPKYVRSGMGNPKLMSNVMGSIKIPLPPLPIQEEKSYTEYMEGFTDIATGEARRGYVDIVKELNGCFPSIDNIVTEKDKKDFAKLFGEFLRAENILQNYDEFASLKTLQSVDLQDTQAVEAFKAAYYVSNEEIAAMQEIALPEERTVQDYRSTYNDIRDWILKENTGKKKEESSIDWDDVIFEVDLLKSQEINLDYILELIFEKNKKSQNKET